MAMGHCGHGRFCHRGRCYLSHWFEARCGQGGAHSAHPLWRASHRVVRLRHFRLQGAEHPQQNYPAFDGFGGAGLSVHLGKMFSNLLTFILFFCIFAACMIVTFDQIYLQELYVDGKASDKKHRYQPQIVSKYVRVINLMKQQENVLGLTKYGSLHYEKLHGDKEGFSSVRVNDQYRIEFAEAVEAGKSIATICNITELSNHYK